MIRDNREHYLWRACVLPGIRSGTVSALSRQAQRLARELTRLTGVDVAVAYDGGQHYLVQWGNGPMAGMSDFLTAELSTGEYPHLPTRMLSCARGYSAQAFAARAVSARRDGTLVSAIQAGVLEHERLGFTPPSWARLSGEELAAHQYVESLLDETAYPEQPDTPADELFIASLIQLSGGNEYAMLPMLISPDSDSPAARGLPRTRNSRWPGSRASPMTAHSLQWLR
jgi:hypothetical protein